MKIATTTANRVLYPKENDVACSEQDIQKLFATKPYVPVTGKYALAILTNKKLPDLTRLYILLVDIYAKINFSKNKGRIAEFSATQWASWLNCSNKWIFKQQKIGEELGFLQIVRAKD